MRYASAVSRGRAASDEPENCSICWDSLANGAITRLLCGHTFHHSCIANYADAEAATTDGTGGRCATRRHNATVACPNCRRQDRPARNADESADAEEGA